MSRQESYGHRTRREHLSPAEKRILLILLDKDSAVEMSAEIAKETGYSIAMVDHWMVRIYRFFGVRSAKGLLRLFDEISKEIADNANI